MLNTTMWDNTTEQTVTHKPNSFEKNTFSGEIIILMVFITIFISLCLQDCDLEDCEECCIGEKSNEDYVEHDIRYYTVV